MLSASGSWGFRSLRGLRDNRGSTTAEFATALPAVVLVLVCCLGAVQVVGVQVRLTDAAASAARALARGDSAGRAAGLVRNAVTGASLSSDRRGEFVCTRVTAQGLPGLFVALTLEAHSCALAGGL
ncbi:TadE family type IV pilus minor pilin [Cryobacterium sp. PH31-O1]|uniref:TadE family type IV pilus minor pilin n=1 Tax=Cryobacterium sp. PH31-O1 TaxID=3046306 RepID=UPI0024BB339F|nr:TadE family type IV pilus minor pilin [Cryobacterium sp. PH31-O1]MDJ0338164.1 TadE family type IV pilus minor pilin [Cryobacterium sp. PH31-O1]